ncbi:hypothetical protein C8F01DRAFT_1121665 [Mycena amicta]|nr:hypothetical protein C8F01DRAFT_1121665 [Mycena amicta]
MSSASTFCSAPVSCSLDSTSQQAQVSLEWVLSAGIRSCGGEVRGTLLLDASGTTVSMLLCAVVRSSLPYDLLLGRDWLHFCRDTLPDAVFTLSSGIVHPGKPSGGVFRCCRRAFLICLVMHATSPSPSLSSPLPLDRVNPTEPALSRTSSVFLISLCRSQLM